MASARKLPGNAELEDDQTAAVLYSPFREKSVNPNSWNRKMKFWENYLFADASETKIISFSVKELPGRYIRKGIAPKCLATVIDELKRSGKIRPISDYQKSTGWLSWGLNALVKQPLSWGVSQLLGSPKKETEIYVWPEILQECANQVVQNLHSSTENSFAENLLTIAEFRESIGQPFISSDQDFEILITHLEKERKLSLLHTTDFGIVVKLCRPGQQKADSISDQDFKIFSLNKAEKKLEREIEILRRRIDECKSEARVHLREGRKTMAKHCLRKKSIAVKAIDKKSGSLLLLQDIVQKIHDAKSNEMIVKACEAGAAALNSLNSEISLEKVEAVMDEVQEATSNQGEINEVLSTTSADAGDDDEILEQELKVLLEKDVDKFMKDEENRREIFAREIKNVPEMDDETLNLELNKLCIDDLELPDVPTHSPFSSKTKIHAGSSAQGSSGTQAS